jgi:hypothetical protein
MKRILLPSSEVAYILRLQLGPIRAWDDCLADMRLSKTHVNGYILLPECQGKGGKAWRPLYQASKVREFIKAVRAANPDATRNAPLQTKTVFSDPTDHRPWRLRKLIVAAAAFTVERPAPTVAVGV